jgi:hypothetical protein
MTFNASRPVSYGPDSNTIIDDQGRTVSLSDAQLEALRRDLNVKAEEAAR